MYLVFIFNSKLFNITFMTQILNVLISYLARMTLFFLLSLTSPCIPNLASKTTVKESARLRLLLCVLNTSVSSTSSLYDDVGMPWRVIRTWPSNWTLPSRPPVLCVNSTVRRLTRLFFWYLPSLGRLEMKRCSYWTLRVNSQMDSLVQRTGMHCTLHCTAVHRKALYPPAPA